MMCGTLDKKRNAGHAHTGTPVPHAGAGELAGGYIEALELCQEILQRSEEGEYYLPEDLTERIRNI